MDGGRKMRDLCSKSTDTSDYDWIMADMLNSHLSKYSTFVLEECQGDETMSDRQDR